MTLCHVGNFMRHDAREFALILRRDQCAREHRNETAGKREGVDFPKLHRKELETVRCHRCGSDQPVPKPHQILMNIRIMEVIRALPDLLHGLLADLPLISRREFAGASRRAK